MTGDSSRRLRPPGPWAAGVPASGLPMGGLPIPQRGAPVLAHDRGRTAGKGGDSVKNYVEGWSDLQRGLYDEAYDLGLSWSTDPGTSPDEIQELLRLGDAVQSGELAGTELDFSPLVDGVAEATGMDVTTVPADYTDPGFRGFVDGARDGASDDVYGV